MGKNPTQRDQKQLHINVRRREEMRREEGKIIDDKTLVHIVRLSILLSSYHFLTKFQRRKIILFNMNSFSQNLFMLLQLCQLDIFLLLL